MAVLEYAQCGAADVILQRARNELGSCGYELFHLHCEQFAHWCKTGNAPYSLTLRPNELPNPTRPSPQQWISRTRLTAETVEDSCATTAIHSVAHCVPLGATAASLPTTSVASEAEGQLLYPSPTPASAASFITVAPVKPIEARHSESFAASEAGFSIVGRSKTLLQPDHEIST